MGKDFENNTEDIGAFFSEDIPISRGTSKKRNVSQLQDGGIPPKKKKMSKKKKRKILIISLSILVGILAVALAFGIWYMYDITKDINYDPDESLKVDEDAEFGVYDENLSFAAMYDITNINSYKDYLFQWSNNGGEIIHSKNVTNVLLIGEDGDATETTNGRSDCMMIASINRKDKKVVLTSIMRDCYTCFDTKDGRQYGKINSACLLAGYPGLIKTIENFYKVDIDYYLSVNFNSFPKLINALGGVIVPVQQYEAEYINSTTVHTIKYGNSVKLDGWEALVFCRIRHCDADSDVSRTRRQRTLITAIINSAKTATKGQLLNAIKVTSPYIKTNMTNNLLIKFGTAALTQNWMSYKMEQLSIPDQNTGIDSMIDGQSCWTVDYPLAAQKVQMKIYGITNIVLADKRLTLEELKSYAQGSSGNDEEEYSTVNSSYYDEEPDYSLSYDRDTTSESDYEGYDEPEYTEAEPSSEYEDPSGSGEGEGEEQYSDYNEDETPSEQSEAE